MFLVYYILSLFHKKENKVDNRIYYTMLVPLSMYSYYFYMYITSKLPQQSINSLNNFVDNSVESNYSYSNNEINNKPMTYDSSNESLMSEPYPVSSSSD
jgi:hypothetical protein